MNLSFASESFYWRYSTKEHFSRGTSPESLGEPKSCENSLYLVFPQTFSFSQTFTRVSITINITKLQSPTKVLARLSSFAAPVWEIYHFTPSPRFMLFIVMNPSLLLSNIAWGEGGSYSSDAITDCFQDSLSTHFHAI